MPRITIELYGIARRRAGIAETTVEATTVREALHALAVLAPVLDGEILRDGAAVAPWRISLDGTRFLTDGREPLADGARLLVLSSLAGG